MGLQKQHRAGRASVGCLEKTERLKRARDSWLVAISLLRSLGPNHWPKPWTEITNSQELNKETVVGVHLNAYGAGSWVNQVLDKCHAVTISNYTDLGEAIRRRRTSTRRKGALGMRPRRIPRGQSMFHIGKPQIAETGRWVPRLFLFVGDQRLVDKGGGLTTPQPK